MAQSKFAFLATLLLSVAGCGSDTKPPNSKLEEADLKHEDPHSKSSDTQLEDSVENANHASSKSEYEWFHFLETIQISFRGAERRGLDYNVVSEMSAWLHEGELYSTLKNAAGEEIYFLCHFHGEKLACHKRRDSGPGRPLGVESEDEPTINHDLPE